MLFKHQTTHQVCRTDALAAKSCVRACWGNPKELQSSGVSGGAGITTGIKTCSVSHSARVGYWQLQVRGHQIRCRHTASENRNKSVRLQEMPWPMWHLPKAEIWHSLIQIDQFIWIKRAHQDIWDGVTGRNVMFLTFSSFKYFSQPTALACWALNWILGLFSASPVLKVLQLISHLHTRAPRTPFYVTSFWMLLEFRSVGVIPFYVWLRSSGIRMIHLHPAHFTDRLRHEVTRRLNECSKCATRARWKVWKEERSSTCWESDVQNWPDQNL